MDDTLAPPKKLTGLLRPHASRRLEGGAQGAGPTARRRYLLLVVSLHDIVSLR